MEIILKCKLYTCKFVLNFKNLVFFVFVCLRVRLVESKIRHLIVNLERNQYINIAHINPQGYEQIKENAYVFCFFYFFLVIYLMLI